MALTNCSINTASLTKTGGAAIGGQNAQLIITPNEGYAVSASNFTNNTGSITGVSNITLSDSTSAGAVGNTVLVSVDLDDSYVMPSANTTLTIDINGAASLIQYTVSGAYTTSVSNATPSSETLTSWSANGTAGSTITISQLSKTFTASSGHHFEIEPSVIITAENESRYTITKTRSYTDNRLTAVAFEIKYTFSSESESTALFEFFANAVEFIVPTIEITNYSINKAGLNSAGDERFLTLFGSVNAVARVTITDQNQNSYNFGTDLFTALATHKDFTISDFGDGSIYARENIIFPERTNTTTYTVVINTNLPSNNSTIINDDLDDDTDTTRNTTPTTEDVVTFTLKQGADRTIQVGATHSDDNVEVSENYSVSLPEGSNTPNNSTNILEQIFTINSLSGPLKIISQPSASDFTNTNSSNNGGTTINITSVSLELNDADGGAALQIAGNIGEIGNANVTSLLDLTSFIKINNKTTVSDITVPCPKLGKAKLQLKSQDADGDTMTHSLVSSTGSAGNLGSIVAVSNTAGPPSVKISEVEYTNTDASVEKDEIFFKANDGTEDSAIGKITVLLENSTPTANDQTISCKSGEFISFDLDVKDSDHSHSQLEYQFFPKEFADDGVTTIIQPPTDGLIYFNKSGNAINAPGKAVYSNNGREIQQQEIIKYRVTDPVGDSDTAQLTINLTSDPLAISQLDNRSHEVTEGAGSTSPIVLEGRSPTGHTPLQFLLTTAPTGGTLHYQSNFSDAAITASSTNVLTSNNLYFNHTASNSFNTQFQFKAKDSLNNIGSRGFVSIIVNEVPAVVGAIYGSFNVNDDNQSGTGVATKNYSYTTSSPRTNTQRTFSGLSVVTTQSNTVFRIQCEKTSANDTWTVHAMEIKLFSNSARTNEVTNPPGGGNPERILDSTNRSITTSYSDPWGGITIPNAGTYYVRVILTDSISRPGQAIQSFRLRATTEY
jgi:hypothetical protein